MSRVYSRGEEVLGTLTLNITGCPGTPESSGTAPVRSNDTLDKAANVIILNRYTVCITARCERHSVHLCVSFGEG